MDLPWDKHPKQIEHMYENGHTKIGTFEVSWSVHVSKQVQGVSTDIPMLLVYSSFYSVVYYP